MELGELHTDALDEWIASCEDFLARDDIRDNARQHQENVLGWLRAEKARR